MECLEIIQSLLSILWGSFSGLEISALITLSLCKTMLEVFNFAELAASPELSQSLAAILSSMRITNYSQQILCDSSFTQFLSAVYEFSLFSVEKYYQKTYIVNSLFEFWSFICLCMKSDSLNSSFTGLLSKYISAIWTSAKALELSAESPVY